MAALLLAGCGLGVPSKTYDETPNPERANYSAQGEYENRIVSHLVCEVANGLYAAESAFTLPWLVSPKWGTAITITITAQDQGGVSPGLSFFKPFENHIFTFTNGGNVTSAQSFTMGIGASVSANATRTETIQFTLVNDALYKFAKRIKPKCELFEGGLMIDGDLRIREFIYDKAVIADLGNANLFAGRDVANNYKYPIYNTFTETINFVATFSGNVNPSWKLARFSNNTSGSGLGSAARTYTNNVIITIGPLGKPPTETAAASLDSAGTNQHQAQVQGGANATAAKGQTTP
jgi:hypothetical protein